MTSRLRSALARIADLPLEVERVAVEPLERPRAEGSRRTALVRLHGGGKEGLGEEVTFQNDDLLRKAPGPEAWAGVSTVGELWERLDRVVLFERPPRYDVVRSYRRWALEAAALDLALRQARLSFGGAVGRRPRPVRFVVSPRHAHLRRFSGARLKIDASELEPDLPVDIVDFKGEGDAGLVQRALELYPAALFEDPPVLVDGARVSWDVRIRSAEDVRRLPSRPAAINVKPARLGTICTLFAVYEACAERGIPMYGGGQDELGPGRRQIQVLAALFHPDAPNDVAPAGYNDAEPDPSLPPSPLAVRERRGFG